MTHKVQVEFFEVFLKNFCQNTKGNEFKFLVSFPEIISTLTELFLVYCKAVKYYSDTLTFQKYISNCTKQTCIQTKKTYEHNLFSHIKTKDRSSVKLIISDIYL